MHCDGDIPLFLWYIHFYTLYLKDYNNTLMYCFTVRSVCTTNDLQRKQRWIALENKSLDTHFMLQTEIRWQTDFDRLLYICFLFRGSKTCPVCRKSTKSSLALFLDFAPENETTAINRTSNNVLRCRVESLEFQFRLKEEERK